MDFCRVSVAWNGGCGRRKVLVCALQVPVQAGREGDGLDDL